MIVDVVINPLNERLVLTHADRSHAGESFS